MYFVSQINLQEEQRNFFLLWDTWADLLQAKSGSDFVQIEQKIKDKEVAFKLVTSVYSCDQDMTKDNIPMNLLPYDAHSQPIPVKSYGDQNCPFSSFSLILFGHENNHTELKIRSVAELACNEELYLDSDTFDAVA